MYPPRYFPPYYFAQKYFPRGAELTASTIEIVVQSFVSARVVTSDFARGELRTETLVHAGLFGERLES